MEHGGSPQLGAGLRLGAQCVGTKLSSGQWTVSQIMVNILFTVGFNGMNLEKSRKCDDMVH